MDFLVPIKAELPVAANYMLYTRGPKSNREVTKVKLYKRNTIRLSPAARTFRDSM
jgi:hypothetical protein